MAHYRLSSHCSLPIRIRIYRWFVFFFFFFFFFLVLFCFPSDHFCFIYCQGEIRLVLQINAPNVLPIPLAEIRNEEEFGEGSEESTYDENSTTPANDLGLLVSNPTIELLTLHA